MSIPFPVNPPHPKATAPVTLVQPLREVFSVNGTPAFLNAVPRTPPFELARRTGVAFRGCIWTRRLCSWCWVVIVGSLPGRNLLLAIAPASFAPPHSTLQHRRRRCRRCARPAPPPPPPQRRFLPAHLVGSGKRRFTSPQFKLASPVRRSDCRMAGVSSHFTD